MFRVDEVGILVVHVQDILQHSQYQAWDGKDLGEGAETQWGRDGNEQ
jgi:hypothetical protein